MRDPTEPDVIVVDASHEEELPADKADLHVSIEGTSLVTGRAALQKAREVSALVRAVVAEGVAEADIQLEGVQAQVTSGLLGKSSTAIYRLRIRARDLDRLAEVLGAITAQRNATLERIAWGYPDTTAAKVAWLVQAIGLARQKADAAATALGVELLGVHRLTEVALDEEERRPQPFGGSGLARSKSAMTSADLGLEVSHAKRAGVRVSIAFRVGGFA